MPSFNDLDKVKTYLRDAQLADQDIREEARDDEHFIHKSDGQWEPGIATKMGARPRYTFDKTNPVVDSIAGEIEQTNFSIKVLPSSNEAKEDIADVYAGLIRNIQNISKAASIYRQSGRKMVETGFDAWMVKQDYIDGDSFDQDLYIKKIHNAIDRVWFIGGEEQDKSDAQGVFVLHAISKDEYDQRFPDGSGESISMSIDGQVYYYKPDYIILGEFFYKKPYTRVLHLMNNGAVYEENEEFKQIQDELASQGITIQSSRKRKGIKVYSRLFDNKEWLTGEQETVFDYLPVVPVYGNYTVSENKSIWRGAVRKLKDPQRVYNYAQSRAVEEGALAPRRKFMMTMEQAKGHTARLATMNTNADPVQFYNHIDGQPAPYELGGAQINPGLAQTAADMKENIVEASGIFSASRGQADFEISGIALDKLQNKGDTSTVKYFKSLEVAIAHTCRIIVNAIPKVYDKQRQVRILGEDGASKIEKLNSVIIDEQTGQPVKVNDLSIGKYDVICTAGQAFQNRQQETVSKFIELATIDPSILEQGKDIMISNMNQPGMDALAERIRKRMLETGIIPDSQMTDEEKAAVQAIIQAAQANPPQPSPMDAAIMEQTQANTADIQSKAMERMEKIKLERDKFDAKMVQDQNKLILDKIQTLSEVILKQSQAWNYQREAMGADAIISEKGADVFEGQAGLIDDAQEFADESPGPDSI